MRSIYVFGNWKMNTNLAEAMVLSGAVARRSEEFSHVQIAIFPPAIWLVPIKERHKRLTLGAQNVYSLTEGAYTGEISVTMLKGIARYALVGHSERRTVFGEDDALINTKVKTVFRAGLTPVLAVGETEPIKIEGLTEQGITQRIWHSQLAYSLRASAKGLTQDQWRHLILAYEPVWAIGTGKNASAHYAARIIQELRALVAKMASAEVAKNLPVLYGGSVTRHSAAEYAGQAEVDGVLVGGASLKTVEFGGIIEAFASASKWR